MRLPKPHHLPGLTKVSNIGGNAVENSGGLRGLKYAVTRDYVMGLELVLPGGEVMSTGNKSAKDVAGYSLRDLFIGSGGTLVVGGGVSTRDQPPRRDWPSAILLDSPCGMVRLIHQCIRADAHPKSGLWFRQTCYRSPPTHWQISSLTSLPPGMCMLVCV